MAGDLDRALQAGPESFRAGGVPAGPGVLLLIREGVLQDWERIFIVFRYIIYVFRYVSN